MRKKTGWKHGTCVVVWLVASGVAWAEQPVQPGDIAFGVSLADPNTTALQVRAGAQVGNWSALPYVQATEFDNFGNIRHNRAGNLLALNFGTTASGGSVYNLSTNGSNQGQVLFALNSSNPYGLTQSRIGGLSVSPNNQYIAFLGYDTGLLYVLAYDAGAAVGTGSGASITGGWQSSAAVVPAGRTQGTTWLDNGNVLVYACDPTAGGVSRLYSVPFTGSGLGTPVLVATIYSGNDPYSMVTDVEYNPAVAPYVFCHFASFYSSQRRTVNTLTVLDPSSWSQLKQIVNNTTMNTGREIALGPDRYLYLSQFGRAIDKINLDRDGDFDVDGSDIVALTDNSSVDVFSAPAGDSFVGLDVAFGPLTGSGACCIGQMCVVTTPANCTSSGGTYRGDGTVCDVHTCDPTGACCNDINCSITTQYACTLGGGTYLGNGTACAPNPCLYDMTIAQAKAVGPGKEVRLANVIVSNTIDTIASANSRAIHLQDATGGITVYGTNLDVDTLLGYFGDGDRVKLVGVTGTFNGLFQLQAPFRDPVNLGYVGVPDPNQHIAHASDFADGSPTAEALESVLVKVPCVTIQPQPGSNGTWQLGNHVATDSTGSFIIRVSTSDMDLIGTPIPTVPVDVVGIFSQYDTAAPYDGGYQLLIRSSADVMGGGGCGEPTGSCCVSATCSITTAAACAAAGGSWNGPGTSCSPNPCVGACCDSGTCTLELESNCLPPRSFLGNGTQCFVAVCPVPVQDGDLALGLNSGSVTRTTQHIRNDGVGHGYQVGAWSSRPFLQAMEFDNARGVLHNATGNLLAMNFGAGGGSPGAPPTCSDPNRPEEGAKLYNLATDGSNRSQLLWDFNSRTGNPNPHSSECTRGGGLSVSPDNQYLAVWGVDTKHLYVLGYGAGLVGTGTGAAITGEYIYSGLAGTAGDGTIGTAWYDSQTVLVFVTAFVPGQARLYSVDFVGGTFSNLVLRTTVNHPVGTTSLFTDVEYNPEVSPYVFCMYSTFTASVSSTYLTAIDPADWSVVKQISISGSCQTGREIALGPDGYLYIAQYAGAGTPRTYVDRISTANVSGWTEDSTEDYYVMTADPTYAAYVGLDVAFGPGLCPGDTNCDGEITFADIDSFVEALGGEENWTHAPCPWLNADCNNDGDVTFADIDAFVALIGTSCP